MEFNLYLRSFHFALKSVGELGVAMAQFAAAFQRILPLFEHFVEIQGRQKAFIPR